MLSGRAHSTPLSSHCFAKWRMGFEILTDTRQRVINVALTPAIELHVGGLNRVFYVAILKRLVDNIVREGAEMERVGRAGVVVMCLGIQPANRPMIPPPHPIPNHQCRQRNGLPPGSSPKGTRRTPPGS